MALQSMLPSGLSGGGCGVLRRIRRLPPSMVQPNSPRRSPFNSWNLPATWRRSSSVSAALKAETRALSAFAPFAPSCFTLAFGFASNLSISLLAENLNDRYPVQCWSSKGKPRTITGGTGFDESRRIVPAKPNAPPNPRTATATAPTPTIRRSATKPSRCTFLPCSTTARSPDTWLHRPESTPYPTFTSVARTIPSSTSTRQTPILLMRGDAGRTECLGQTHRGGLGHAPGVGPTPTMRAG